MNRKQLFQFLEKELLALLAVTLLLGIIVGYSLAASYRAETLTQPDTSILRTEFGGETR